jgi:hypothetical protein
MMNSSEMLPVVDSLKNAAGLKWSGMLRAKRAGEQVGVVVMHDGHVAWAVCSGQAEDFSSVLERVGLVSRDKLSAANLALQKHRSLGKTMSLGALLVEECLISFSVLRTCFKTHVSAAIASLAETPLLSLHPADEQLSVDANLLFHVNEVLPDQEPGTELPLPLPSAPLSDVMEKGDLLKSLLLLPGYRYSFIADTDGKLLACNLAEEVQVQVNRIIPKALTWLSAACTLSEETEMGQVVSAFLHGETGSLFAQMTDTSKRFFVAISFSSAGKLGVIKHKISELMPTVRRFTDAL